MYFNELSFPISPLLLLPPHPFCGDVKHHAEAGFLQEGSRNPLPCTINPCHTLVFTACHQPRAFVTAQQAKGWLGRSLWWLQKFLGGSRGDAAPQPGLCPTFPALLHPKSSLVPKSLPRAQQRMFASLKPEHKERNLY